MRIFQVCVCVCVCVCECVCVRELAHLGVWGVSSRELFIDRVWTLVMVKTQTRQFDLQEALWILIAGHCCVPERFILKYLIIIIAY